MPVCFYPCPDQPGNYLSEVVSHKSLSPIFSSIELSCTGYSAIPETPEDKRTRKQSYFKHRRGVQFLDVSSDSEDEEPRNFSAAKENRVPRRDVVVMYPEDELPQLAYVNGGDQLPAVKKGVEEDIRDAKLQTLKELFPQRSDQELLQVIMLSFSTSSEAKRE
uniref:Uncharacterized protein n=1 Tax=Strix occidentalis caurina TaxID=311401 RepID=A0A8D0FVP1_STROC